MTACLHAAVVLIMSESESTEQTHGGNKELSFFLWILNVLCPTIGRGGGHCSVVCKEEVKVQLLFTIICVHLEGPVMPQFAHTYGQHALEYNDAFFFILISVSTCFSVLLVWLPFKQCNIVI